MQLKSEERARSGGARKYLILIPICLFILFLVGAVIFVIPRQKDISKSSIFSGDDISAYVKRDIERLNNGEYEALRAESSAAMQEVLKDGLMESIQKQTGDQWGAFSSFGEITMTEVTQGGQKFAVSDIIVNYENAKLTFRITYDSDMKLSGLYVR